MGRQGIRLLLGGSLALAVLGCGGDKIATVPVSGIVKLDGQPLANASVSFQPVTRDAISPGSHGRTDAQGRFRLQVTVSGQLGAVTGHHQVRVATGAPAATSNDNIRSRPPDLVPARYQDGSLTFEVPPKGTDQANFDLTSR
jgi:hypothetical protein